MQIGWIRQRVQLRGILLTNSCGPIWCKKRRPILIVLISAKLIAREHEKPCFEGGIPTAVCILVCTSNPILADTIGGFANLFSFNAWQWISKG